MLTFQAGSPLAAAAQLKKLAKEAPRQDAKVRPYGQVEQGEA